MKTLLGILYDATVTPLVYLFGLVYAIFFRLVDSPGWAILGVSLVVNLLCLPLYRMADAAQQAERDRQAQMAHWVDHIKRTFKGDERYMMLTTYYRQRGYKQVYALSSSISLLLQVPIFIAAYRYLSDLSILRGASFMGIPDLGSPDGLLTLGGTAINVLPVLMTVLNVVSSAVYTRDLPLRDKAQTYGLALLFLVLLYRSPAGLVLYWTCNQVFSLVKNVVTSRIAGQGGAKAARSAGEGQSRQGDRSLVVTFLLAALLLSAIMGVLIPSALIGNSPSEFINTGAFVNPLRYLIHTLATFGGLFVLWVGVYFFLSGRRGREGIALACLLLVGVCLVDYLFFGRNLGVIRTSLVFEEEPVFAAGEMALNAAVLLALCGGVYALWRFGRSVVNPLLAILLIAITCMAVPNVYGIYSTAEGIKRDMAASAAEAEAAALAAATTQATSGDAGSSSEAPSTARRERPQFDDEGNILPIVSLSREGKNVIVVFLDRAIGAYLPYVLAERPDLVQRLDGFTFYPNTISYGHYTVFGAPALCGGYEYTLSAMNARTDELLVDEHNESILVMPKLFADAGYDVSLFDPTLVNYQFGYSDHSIFEPYPEMAVYETFGTYAGAYSSDLQEATSESFRRNLCFYSVFKAAPVALQGRIYDHGNYFSTIMNHTVSNSFLFNYSVLAYLRELTEVTDGGANAFLMIHNNATHNPDLLQYPEYEPSLYLDFTKEDYSRFTLDGVTMHMDNDTQLSHYHAYVATLLRLADWFDYLRAEGVYDNTRIIVVSDHGSPMNQFDDLIKDDLDVEGVNPLLLVKDFDAHGEVSTSSEFMSNADTPTLAMAGLIQDPVNPFTGNPINSDDKYATPQLVTTSERWDVREFHLGTTFETDDGNWYEVHDDIFDLDNWTLVTQ